ncbi:hypothetical protein QBC39DRAFT_382948, partial [Podospora conica]
MKHFEASMSNSGADAASTFARSILGVGVGTGPSIFSFGNESGLDGGHSFPVRVAGPSGVGDDLFGPPSSSGTSEDSHTSKKSPTPEKSPASRLDRPTSRDDTPGGKDSPSDPRSGFNPLLRAQEQEMFGQNPSRDGYDDRDRHRGHPNRRGRGRGGRHGRDGDRGRTHGPGRDGARGPDLDRSPDPGLGRDQQHDQSFGAYRGSRRDGNRSQEGDSQEGGRKKR